MDWVGQVGRLRQWSRGGERAPHKPLLLLYALGRHQHDAAAELPYTEAEHRLRGLLDAYGPPRRTTPAYPFHHLVNDGVWEVRSALGTGSPGPNPGALRRHGAKGRLAPGLRRALADDPALLGRLVHLLLDAHFPPSLHEEIAVSAGLDLEAAGRPGTRLPAPGVRRRTGALREAVLVGYAYRCAFCGYDGALGTDPVGLEAAHVRWWAFEGPDDLSNGLCLCSLHHKLLDKGVLGLDPERRIMVSQRFVGRGAAARTQVLDLVGRPVDGPQAGLPAVADEHIRWHTRQVFHGAPRLAA